MQKTPSKTDEIKTLLKRCRPDVIEAAIDYQASKNPHLLSLIVGGIIERYLEPEAREKLKDPQSDNLLLIEDLGMDSLIFVEIVMTVETILDISIPDQELKGLRTIEDVKKYISQKVNNDTLASLSSLT